MPMLRQPPAIVAAHRAGTDDGDAWMLEVHVSSLRRIRDSSNHHASVRQRIQTAAYRAAAFECLVACVWLLGGLRETTGSRIRRGLGVRLPACTAESGSCARASLRDRTPNWLAHYFTIK